MSATSPRAGRVNRQQAVLEGAAALFRRKGYAATSMRDIASACDMLPGSLYFHFNSKEAIYIEVQRRGIEHVIEAVDAGVSNHQKPWDRLEAACQAHLSMVLDESDFAAVLIGAVPMEDETVWREVCRMRDAYEDRFRALIDDLPLPQGTDRKYLRLALLGAMNWTPTWYRPGRDNPADVASRLLDLIRGPLEIAP